MNLGIKRDCMTLGQIILNKPYTNLIDTNFGTVFISMTSTYTVIIYLCKHRRVIARPAG